MGLNQPLYWEGEEFILDEEKLKDIKGVDILVSHTSPEWCFPDNRGGHNDFVKGYAKYDASLIPELDRERKMFSKLFEILKKNNRITKHFYGHFHRSDVTYNSYTEHILLNINEFKMVDNPTDDDYESLFT